MARKKRKGFKRTKAEWEESIVNHIGKFVDRLTPRDIIDTLLNVGLAYAGVELFKDWKGALVGPISLKLAQTVGGTPPVSQIAGLAGLVFLGGAFGAKGVPPQEGGGEGGFWERKENLKCPEGYVLDWNIVSGWHCRQILGPPT